MKNGNVDIERIQEFILSFAEGNFSKRAEISPRRDDTDTILAGINMLGEELESLTVSRDYFLSIYNAISDLLIVVDNDGKIKNVNDAVCRKLQSSRDELIGKNVEGLFGYEKKFDTMISHFQNEKESYLFETSILHNKTNLPVRCFIAKITDEIVSLDGYVITAMDISFEKAVEKEILNTVIATEEKEKTRIAYDLHDSLGQELNAIKMYFNVAMRSKDNAEKFDSIMNECGQLLDQSIESVRKIAKDIMPKALEDGELFSALSELSNSISKIITVENRLPEDEFTLSKESKVKVYRIIQEFFANTLKHSGASQLGLSAGTTRNGYYFKVEDNGKGFNKTSSKLGNGVKNIETRLKTLEAEYDYTSKINEGTILNFELSG